MKRRTFIASVAAAPALLPVVTAEAAPLPLNLDELLDALYALKRDRDMWYGSWHDGVELSRPSRHLIIHNFTGSLSD